MKQSIRANVAANDVASVVKAPGVGVGRTRDVDGAKTPALTPEKPVHTPVAVHVIADDPPVIIDSNGECFRRSRHPQRDIVPGWSSAKTLQRDAATHDPWGITVDAHCRPPIVEAQDPTASCMAGKVYHGESPVLIQQESMAAIGVNEVSGSCAGVSNGIEDG